MKCAGIILFTLFVSTLQEHDLFFRSQKIVNNEGVTLFCNVTFSEQEFVYQLEWLKDVPFDIPERLSINKFEYLNSTSKKKVEVVSFLKVINEGQYMCRIRTKKFGESSSNYYYDYLVVSQQNLKSQQHLVTKTWVKLLMETEGVNTKIECVYNFEKFQSNNKWFNYNNESIISNERIRTTDLFIEIKNLTFTDQNAYRCVSPNNEFYTALVVTKNYKKW